MGWRVLAAGVLLVVVAACSSPEASAPAGPAAAGVRESSVEGLTLRYGSLRDRSVDIDADGRITTAAVAGMNAFAVDLYAAVAAGEPANVVVSPYSVAAALSMIYAGARGDTKAEMASVLHDDDAAAWQEGLNAYDLSLEARTAGSPTSWESANKVWTRPGLALRDEFLDVLTGVFGSPLAEADFGADPDGVRQVINGWVSEQTKDRIPELFAEGSISSAAVMVLVNAVALDAPWEFPFDPDDTRDAPFTRPDGSTVNVPTMHYDEFLPAAVTPDYQAVELPYGGGALSMGII